jgi:hypothetical protein
MSNVNRTAVQARDTKIVAGIAKRLQSVQSLSLLGTAYTPVSLTALFQSQIGSIGNIAALRAQLKDALQADRALARQMTALVRALRNYLVNVFGSSSEVLGDFGFPFNRTSKAKPATKVAAAVKARATRKARGTMGSKQKKAIKGATPASPSPAATPAVSGSEAGASNGAPPHAPNAPGTP